METLASEIWTALELRHADARLIAHGGGNRRLPIFLLSAWVRTFALVVRRRVDVVVCYDATTLIVLWPLLALVRAPNVALVNGLDLAWPRAPYQFAVRTVLPRASRVLAISTATAAVARARGVAPERLAVVRLGVRAPAVSDEDRRVARSELHDWLGLDGHVVVVLTLGRLVARKGVRWFVEEVLPELPERVHYVVAGSGPERVPIERAAATAGIGARVHLLGRVSDAARETLLRGADLFVQPNVRTPGDMEGFGLVLVEAAKRGTPVVASALEGMQDAVVDGETGTLCPPGDRAVWQRTVHRLTADRAALDRLGRQGRVGALERFGPDVLADQLDGELTRAMGVARGRASRRRRRGAQH